MATDPNQLSERQIALAVFQPIDRVTINLCQLLCFPNYLQLIIPHVTLSQTVDFYENNSIKIYHFDYLLFLNFLHQCSTIIFTIASNQTSKTLEHKATISAIKLNFAYDVAKQDCLLTISSDNFKVDFDNKSITTFMSGVSSLIFKSYSYSHHTNYVIATFVKEASFEVLRNPTYSNCYAILEKIDCVQLDYFLLYDIILRHKTILLCIKQFQDLDNE